MMAERRFALMNPTPREFISAHGLVATSAER